MSRTNEIFPRVIGSPALVKGLYYKVNGPDFESRYRKDIFLSKNVEIGFGAHPASYSVGTELSSRGKAAWG
jgi:hypothetical protein